MAAATLKIDAAYAVDPERQAGMPEQTFPVPDT